jgi:hypothetical protein
MEIDARIRVIAEDGPGAVQLAEIPEPKVSGSSGSAPLRSRSPIC